MQLIPATARRFGVDNPFDPKQNIEGGTSYLKYLLGLFNGDLALSLAAYNAGEKSVLRQGGIPPFPETKEYVRRVTSLYQPDFAPKPGSGTEGQGSVISGVQKAKIAKKTGNSEVSPGSITAPLYRFIDAKGVVHIEQ
jgi:hypothetical protein